MLHEGCKVEKSNQILDIFKYTGVEESAFIATDTS